MSNTNDLAIIQTRQSINEIRNLITAGKDLIPVVRELKKETQGLNKFFNAGKPKEYANGISNLTNITRQYTAAQRELLQVTQRVSNASRNSVNTAYEEARVRAEAARANREESLARQQLAREQRQNTNNSNQESSAYNRLKREVRESTQTARNYGAQIVELKRKKKEGSISSSEYRTQLRQLRKEFNSSNKDAMELQRQIDKLNKATSAYKQKNGALAGRVTDIVKGFGIVASIDNIASAFLRWGEDAVKTSIKLDSIRLSQKAVFKTNEEVNNQNEFLTKTANRYGVEILSLTDAYTKFAASAKGTYIEGNRTQYLFDAVTKSSALLGVTTDDTTGILRALGQMMSKGKVQAEELRGQLGDRMAGAFKLFADGMGVSTAELDKMLKKGEVLADDVLPKFAEQLNKRYKLDLDKQIDTQTAAINRRTNAWVAFVDNVNSGTGVMTKGVLSFNAAITNFLELITPSKQITIIEQEQAKLNLLGYELRQNLTDRDKVKKIMEEMMQINPFITEGLEKEAANYFKIEERLKAVNEQYAYKIALQKQDEKIKELVEDQAQAYIYINQVFQDNIVEYTKMSPLIKDIFDRFIKGSVSYYDAQKMIDKNTKTFSKENKIATDILYRLNTVVNQASLNFDGYNRGLRGNEEAIKNATTAYNNLVGTFDRLTGKQKQLVFMNGLTAKSFDGMGKEQVDRFKEANEIIQKAVAAGEKFALVRNVWRAQNAKGGWFTTNKKGDDWYLEEGKLLKREKTVITPDPPKPKAATLSAAEKDFVNNATGVRDMEIARLEEKRLDLKISDEQYWKGYEKVVKDYSNKINSYLKGLDAKEIQVKGAVYKRAVDARKQANKELYDIQTKQLEEQNKKELNISERQSKELEKSNFLTDSEKLSKQIELDSQSIVQLEKYYSQQIALAKKSAQPVIEWERKRDEEIGKIQDARSDKFRSKIEAYTKDLERQLAISTSNSNVSFEEQKSLILSDKKLSNAEREYKLQLLEIDKQIAQNNLEIENLKTLKGQYDLQVAMAELAGKENPDAKRFSAETGDQIITLENTNKQLNKEAKDLISESTQALRDAVAQGFSTLGFEHLADAYTKTMDRLKDKTADWKDYANLAVTAVLESLSKLTDRQKEKTLEALDLQLQSSQKIAQQEQDFLQSRIDALNGLGDLNEDQIRERTRLEDEARLVREQQQQREKMIETQKAKAEQHASSNQALINGALGATQSIAQYGFTPAGAIAAALALAFGIAQSVSIMSKDPTPRYWKGRLNGPAEFALTQEHGREIITNNDGVVTSQGSPHGAKKTWLNEGDRVWTAQQSQKIIKNLGGIPKIGQNIFKRTASNYLKAPSINVSVSNNQQIDNSQKIIDGIGKKFENAMSRFSNPNIQRKNGLIIEYHGSRLPVVLGEYDLQTLQETYYENSN